MTPDEIKTRFSTCNQIRTDIYFLFQYFLLICDFQVLILRIVKKFTIPTSTTVNKCFQSLTHGLSDQGVCERLCSA